MRPEGFVTGMLFGLLLQRGRVLRYDRQLGALLLRDMTIVKFMLSAIVTGMACLFALEAAGMARFDVKATVLGANIIGGLVFGAGWGLLGYCPGTQLGALGEGRWDAAWGIAGMVAGAALHAELYPLLSRTVLAWGDFGRRTLPAVLGVSPWLLIPLFIFGSLLLFRWFERKGL
ncbi:MAG: YeeE/YedE thiosulfate transporter family protein [bacterium]|nr:YeeE/YedE thiosulfate transporter family protein [bacterium]